MKKKIVSCILCAAATISLVSGCGSNKETETDKKKLMQKNRYNQKIVIMNRLQFS
ncbi:MAG: hypothetical protein ACLUJR_09125 [Mediterraneibacter gnavus]